MVLLKVSASWESRRGFSRNFALTLGVPFSLLMVLRTIGFG